MGSGFLLREMKVIPVMNRLRTSVLIHIPGIQRLFAFLWIALTLLIWGYDPASASTPEPQVPPGFYLVSEDHGVRLYRKDYSGGKPDYVQVVDLGQGASLRLVHGDMGEPRVGKGMFGGDDYRFQYQSLQQFWRQAVAADEKTFCVLNGQFFYMPETPTRLAMPLKVAGQTLTTGFGYPQYDGEELMLELWPDEARISDLTQRSFYISSAPDIIAGLTEVANKRAKYAVGRTFVGVSDRDSDGVSATVLVLNTLSATQAHAAQVLRDWGAESVMMLDGGGSTQLYCRDGWKVQSERLIPQAIAVVAGSGPPYLAAFSELPSWPVVIAQQSADLGFEVKNIGSYTWEPAEVELKIKISPWGASEYLQLPDPVPPDQGITVTWPADRFYRSGVYQVEINLFNNGRTFPSEPAGFSLVVLPQYMQAQRPELEGQIAAWTSQSGEDIEARARQWLEEESEESLPSQEISLGADGSGFQLNGILLVPAFMLPCVAGLILVLSRYRRLG